MANQWFKFYGGEYLSDPKIERLSPAERSCWITLLCMASMEADGKIEFLTVESLLNKSGIKLDPYNDGDWEKCQSIFSTLGRMKMIDIDEESATITIKNWEKRQEQFSTNAERQAKYRQNKKSNENVTPVTTKVTLEENRIEENRIDKKKINESETSSEDINFLIKAFEGLNPTSKKFYGIPTQRKACKSLIEIYGLERVISVVEKTLPKTNGLQFFPVITTPLQLSDKWVALESAIRKYQSENKIKNKVAFS